MAKRARRRLKFTREGYAFCGVTLAIGVAAINTGNNLLFLVLGAQLSLILLSGIVSDLELRRLKATRLLPDRVHAGRPVQIGFVLENHKRRLATLSVEVEETNPTDASLKACYFLRVPPRDKRTSTYEATFPHRGRIVLEGVRISTGFPFGLFRKSIEMPVAGELIVFPALRPVVLPHAPSYAMPGDLSAQNPARRGEFHGLRDHRPGDDVRDIHWRKTAQRGHPVVKEHHDDTLRRVSLVLDNRIPPSPSADDITAYEVAVSTTASLVRRYIRAGYEVVLNVDPPSGAGSTAAGQVGVDDLAAQSTSGPTLAGRGHAHMIHLLRTLALVEPVSSAEATSSDVDEAPTRASARLELRRGTSRRNSRGAQLHISRNTTHWR